MRQDFQDYLPVPILNCQPNSTRVIRKILYKTAPMDGLYLRCKVRRRSANLPTLVGRRISKSILVWSESIGVWCYSKLKQPADYFVMTVLCSKM